MFSVAQKDPILVEELGGPHISPAAQTGQGCFAAQAGATLVGIVTQPAHAAVMATPPDTPIPENLLPLRSTPGTPIR